MFFLASSLWAASDYCFNCHLTQEGASIKFKKDVHYAAALSCADCHGGDPKINDMNKSKTPEKGFRLRIKRQDDPQFCAGCHSNTKFMATYPSKLPVNQLAEYQRSVHGRKLASGNGKAAECVDCHGIHEIRKVSDTDSPAASKNISATCATCHAKTMEAFKGSPHDGKPLTTCAGCHGSHSVEEARTTMLTGDDAPCANCHKADSKGAKAAAEIADLLDTLQKGGADSKEALARARVAVHTFNVAAIKRAIEDAKTPPAASQAAPQPPSGARGE